MVLTYPRIPARMDQSRRSSTADYLLQRKASIYLSPFPLRITGRSSAGLAVGYSATLYFANSTTCIDLYEGAGLRLDLREPMPFLDNSCAMVHSEHFLEHLAYPHDAMRFLTECFRVLRPGGVFRVGVPDRNGQFERMPVIHTTSSGSITSGAHILNQTRSVPIWNV
jgi:SAM-dependent methyltransferase